MPFFSTIIKFLNSFGTICCSSGGIVIDLLYVSGKTKVFNLEDFLKRVLMHL
jgi:hypothetical protein